MAGSGWVRMSIRYRDACPTDAAALDRLFKSSFCDTFAHLYRPQDLDIFLQGFGVAYWEAQLDDPAFGCRIAEVDGKPIGYIKIGPLKLSIEAEGRALFLDQLYVLKDHHGSGIAQPFKTWAFEEASSLFP